MSSWNEPRSNSRMLLGIAVMAFTVIYLLSDVLEVVQGGFTRERLVLTYLGEAAIPLFVLGLYAVQVPLIGRLGCVGAVSYSYSYIFFSSTVVYALVADSPNYAAVTDEFGGWMVLHGAIMLVGAIAFGVAVARARVLPRWTGVTLAIGGVLVAAASTSTDFVRTVAEAMPAAAFIGMGLALVRGASNANRPVVPARSATSARRPGRSEPPVATVEISRTAARSVDSAAEIEKSRLHDLDSARTTSRSAFPMRRVIAVNPRTPVSRDELTSVSAAIASENPKVDKRDIENLVGDTYQELASRAKVMTHLIPLTLNLSRRTLATGR